MAARKLQGLIQAGAEVIVVAPVVHPDVHALIESGRVQWIQREARDDDLIGANLAFLATADHEVNARFEMSARERGTLVNRADSPDDGTFHVPAVLRRGDIGVGVSTGGRAPGIARLIRDDIESVLTEARIALLDVIGEARQVAHGAGISTSSERWRDLLDDETLSTHVQAGRHDEAVQYIIARLKSDMLARVAR